MEYQTSKSELIGIVKSYQERAYSEDIDLLLAKGDNTDWLVNGLESHTRNGISNDQEGINRRKVVFGTN